MRDEIWKLVDLDANGCGLDFAYLADNFAAGPGASVKADSTSWFSKMWASNHSYTQDYVLALFRAAVTRNDLWTDAYQQWSTGFKPVAVNGNSLFTVPKNSEIGRTCCTEPLLNMFFQQATGSFLEERLKRWGISLARQPGQNRELTRQGSLHGGFATIDLSSASDSISVDLCKWLLPPSVWKWLRLFRSDFTRLPNGENVSLKMVSTMGNGFTFPLETIIFSAAVRAVYILKGLNPQCGASDANYGVFGDDIIVQSDCAHSVIRLIGRLGFKVNEGKTFTSGPFRESCGYDYYKGVNIRPIYIKSLEQSHDVYSAFNRLARWSAENGISLTHTLSLLSGWARLIPVPFSESDDAGFKVPMSLTNIGVEDAWVQYKCIGAYNPPIVAVSDDQGNAISTNPHGLLLAVLGGYARTPEEPFVTPTDPSQVVPACFVFRRPKQGEVLPRRRLTRTIPFWDWFGVQDEGRFSRSSHLTWQREVEAAFRFGR
jgi:hypothetical protein